MGANKRSIVSSCFESISCAFSSWSFMDVEDLHDSYNANKSHSLFLYPSVTTEMTRTSGGADVRYFYKSRTGRRYHYLDTCFLCKHTIRRKHDILMYRGDIPFCSVECLEEQIEMDTSLERIHRKQSENTKRFSIHSLNQRICFRDDDSTMNGGIGNRENAIIVAS